MEVELTFSDLKKRGSKISQVFKAQCVDNWSSALSSCSNWLILAKTGDKTKIDRACLCRNRNCPICNKLRSNFNFKRLSSAVSKLQEENKYEFLFLTLTVRNCHISDLEKTLKMMADGHVRLRKLKKYKDAIVGGIRVLESIRAKDKQGDMIHPHYHCLLVVKKGYFKSKEYIKHQDFKAMWKKCLRINYDPIVDIRKCRNLTEEECAKNEIPNKKALFEISKYATKDLDFININAKDFDPYSNDAELFVKHAKALSGKRLLSTFGVLKDAMKEELTEDELLETAPSGSEIEGVEEVETEYIFARFNWFKARYEIVKGKAGQEYINSINRLRLMMVGQPPKAVHEIRRLYQYIGQDSSMSDN